MRFFLELDVDESGIFKSREEKKVCAVSCGGGDENTSPCRHRVPGTS